METNINPKSSENIHFDDFYDDEEMKIPLDKWLEYRRLGIFKNDDGCGYYGTESKISDIEVFSSQNIPEGMNYVYWYNK